MEGRDVLTSPLQDLLKVGENKAMEKRSGLTELVSCKETPRRTERACKNTLASTILIHSRTRLGFTLRSEPTNSV